MTASLPADGALVASVAVPAGGSATTKVQLGLVTDEIPASRTEYDAVRAATPAAAYTTHVTAYNQWWADNVPYLDTPEDNIDKTLFYRWWLMRFNFLDADIPGNDVPVPDLDGGRARLQQLDRAHAGHVHRRPEVLPRPDLLLRPLGLGGRDLEELQVRRQPRRPGELVEQLHPVHLRGGVALVPAPRRADRRSPRNLAEYAECDVKGLHRRLRLQRQRPHRVQLGRDDGQRRRRGVVRLERRQHGPRRERLPLLERQGRRPKAYRLAGNAAKAAEMRRLRRAREVAGHGPALEPRHASCSSTVHESGEHVPWKEINNYYPFAVGLVPKPGDDDYDDDYVAGAAAVRRRRRVPDLPVLHREPGRQGRGGGRGRPGQQQLLGDQLDGAVPHALARCCATTRPSAIDADWYKKLLYWNAWAHYQNGGDNRLPDENEFWADGSADPQSIGYRSWIHHTILGATNFTMIEDAHGPAPAQRRQDRARPDRHRLGPLHGEQHPLPRPRPHRHVGRARAAPITTAASVPEGYSVFLDGELAFTVDDLAHVVYDPATGEVEVEGDATVTSATDAAVQAPRGRAVRRRRPGRRPVRQGGSRRLRRRAPVRRTWPPAARRPATFSANGRTPAAAVNGTTINEPFWGSAGSPNPKDTLDGRARRRADVRRRTGVLLRQLVERDGRRILASPRSTRSRCAGTGSGRRSRCRLARPPTRARTSTTCSSPRSPATPCGSP